MTFPVKQGHVSVRVKEKLGSSVRASKNNNCSSSVFERGDQGKCGTGPGSRTAVPHRFCVQTGKQERAGSSPRPLLSQSELAGGKVDSIVGLLKALQWMHQALGIETKIPAVLVLPLQPPTPQTPQSVHPSPTRCVLRPLPPQLCPAPLTPPSAPWATP